MNTKHLRKNKHKRTKKNHKGKRWITAIEAAKKTLKNTRSYDAAKISLKKQALTNARKLFGSVGNL